MNDLKLKIPLEQNMRYDTFLEMDHRGIFETKYKHESMDQNIIDDIRSHTIIKVPFKSYKQSESFFEMGRYGLLETNYDKKGELIKWRIILSGYFELKDIVIKNNKKYFKIEVVDNQEKIYLEVKNYFEFRREIDKKTLIKSSSRNLKSAFTLIINEYRKLIGI